MFDYQLSKEYIYDYNSTTTLANILANDGYQVNILAKVALQRAGPCSYQLNVDSVEFSGAAPVSDLRAAADKLTKSAVVFSIDSNGELSSDIKFQGREDTWAQNVKRAIISAFQVRSDKELRVENPLNVADEATEPKSGVIYETDSLGRCRTTYKLKRNADGSVDISKQKATHRCSLNEKITSSIDGEEYEDIPVSFI